MQEYKLVRLLSRKKKDSDKEYYLAYLVLNTDTDCSLLNVLITKKQYDDLSDLIDDSTFNITDYVSIEYNSYQKKYLPVIKY